MQDRAFSTLRAASDAADRFSSSAAPEAPGDSDDITVQPPKLGLPVGGGAIRGIGEKFATNAQTGTASLRVPLPLSPGRSGFTPRLALAYDSGGGNSAYGLGWSLDLPAITRKTDKGLPKYGDADESDVFIVSGAEDLVPVLDASLARVASTRVLYGATYQVLAYRPRVDALFSRIEAWRNVADPVDVFWRTISSANVTTWYGLDATSRIADPQDSTRIFSWLACLSHDDRGNLIEYRFQAEDGQGVDTTKSHERNRSDVQRSAGRYLADVRYGHRTAYFPDLSAKQPTPLPDDPMFEVVFDHGEYDPTAPQPGVMARAWPVRPDPWSTRRPGFEWRIYRRCQRVLMFHHFPEAPEVGANCLVRSLDLAYTDDSDSANDPMYSLLASLTQCGYRRSGAGYTRAAMPALLLTYSRPTIDPAVRDLDKEALRNLPAGSDGLRYQWADLDGEGTSGLLSEQAGTWFYKANLSPGRTAAAPSSVAFAPVQRVDGLPSTAAVVARRQTLASLAGDGRLDLVDRAGATPGFATRRDDATWGPWQPFAAKPNLDWDDPQLRFTDLTGDGLSDALVAEGGNLRWYASLGRAGFEAGRWAETSLDEEQGPRFVFADGTESIFLADMTGDGLSDIVRVRNGSTCYWPNLGYGRFGAKVLLDDSPWLDAPDQFDARRVRLADLDGSGTADLVYFGHDATWLHFNSCGDRFAVPLRLPASPTFDAIGTAQAIDLLGNGTSCLVWSSPLPARSTTPLRWIDLMSGSKPHLLIDIDNQLGAETRIQYAPSTHYSVQDRLAGTPWLTRLPFPVQVVAQVESIDWIGRNRFSTRYAYHHGCFDAVEREFRGFARVDRWDTEEIAGLTADGAFPGAGSVPNRPPVCTRTWYHTGVGLAQETLLEQLALEYFVEPGLTAAQAAAMRRPAPPPPAGVLQADGSLVARPMTPDEAREAARALRGSVLHEEVYAEDGSAAASCPYSVSDQSWSVVWLQPASGQRHAVFNVQASESVQWHYERTLYAIGAQQLADPRVQHTLTLQVDAFGNVLQQSAIAYGRRHPDATLAADNQALQAALWVTLTQQTVSAPLSTADAWATPAAVQADGFELVRCVPAAAAMSGITPLFRLAELRAQVAQACDGAHDLPFEDRANAGATQAHPYRRCISRARTLYLADDLSGPLPLGQAGARRLVHETYRQALTPSLVAAVFGLKLPAATLSAVLTGEAQYRDLDGDGALWQPSGRQTYSPGAPDLSFAQTHFFMPQTVQDPFGNATQLAYDAGNLLLQSLTDPLGNQTLAAYDYRVLQPSQITDANGNRNQAAYDTLGQLAGRAVMGKSSEILGDSLAGFQADLTTAQIDSLASGPDPLGAAVGLLASATAREVHDLDRFARTRAAVPADPTQWQPSFVASIARETHVSDLAPATTTQVQLAIRHGDGFGRSIQIKAPAAPATPGTPLRWTASGWTVFDNKGQPVRQYEPFFSALAATPQAFEFGLMVGVSAIQVRDPPGRVLAIVRPDQTWDKTVMDPWSVQRWDANDTVLEADPRNDADVGAFLSALPAADLLPTWYQQRIGGALGATARTAATLAAAHAGTPGRAWIDALGRSVIRLADNGPAGRYLSRSVLDVQGRLLQQVDELGRRAVTEEVDMLGHSLHRASMEGGERWTLNDVRGSPVRAWDERGHQLRSEYDGLRRPVAQYVRGTDAAQSDPRTLAGEVRYAAFVYGEGVVNAAGLNLRGRLYQQFDNAGSATQKATDPISGGDVAYDFKGNPLASARRFAADPSALIDWAAPPALDPAFTAFTRYDALNRTMQTRVPDGSAVATAYDEAGLPRSVQVTPAGGVATPFVASIAYNARGQRMQVVHGNGAQISLDYDPLTFRLAQLRTVRTGVPANQSVVQLLSYTEDPVGNVTHIQDDADLQDAIYFRNRRVEPSADFQYDALYRLVGASGREQLGQPGGPASAPGPSSYNDAPRIGQALPGDGKAVGTYLETYQYDAASNLLQVKHVGSDPAQAGWSRSYVYAEVSALDPVQVSNRLSRSVLNPQGHAPWNEAYGHDAHGNMLSMPQLASLQWDYLNRLRLARRQAVNADDSDGALHQGERTAFVHDAGGQRLRKATWRANGSLMKERLYLGPYEVYREYDGVGSTVTLERTTLHVMDGAARVALLETRTQGDDGSPAQLARYQYGNHLDSACVELDATGRVVSYEEYTPFGSTSYQAYDAGIRAAAKRYRYSGTERDEETGLQWCATRYYATWLGRWTSADPAGPVEGLNLYAYSSNNPVGRSDPGGQDSDDKKDKPAADDKKSAAKDDDKWRNEPIGGWGGTRYSIDEPMPEFKLNAPNFLSSSYSQSLGIMTKGAGDVEANLYGGASRLTGMHLRPQSGYGLQLGQLQVRQQIEGAPGFDLGVSGSGGYTSQSSDTGDTATVAWSALGLAHYAYQWDSGFGLGAYAAVGAAGQHPDKGDGYTAPQASLTGVVGWEAQDDDGPPKPFTVADLDKPPETDSTVQFKGIDANPTIGYAGRGQLTQGPMLRNLVTAGGYAGVNIGIGEHWSVLPEGGALYTHGSPDTAGGQSGNALTWRAGIAATYNWIEKTTSGPQTSSVSFGAWFSQERGSISQGSPGSTAPSGDYVTNAVMFGATFGFRRTPLLGN